MRESLQPLPRLNHYQFLIVRLAAARPRSEPGICLNNQRLRSSEMPPSHSDLSKTYNHRTIKNALTLRACRIMRAQLVRPCAASAYASAEDPCAPLKCKAHAKQTRPHNVIARAGLKLTSPHRTARPKGLKPTPDKVLRPVHRRPDFSHLSTYDTRALLAGLSGEARGRLLDSTQSECGDVSQDHAKIIYR
jgi:hypothetical protein